MQIASSNEAVASPIESTTTTAAVPTPLQLGLRAGIALALMLLALIVPGVAIAALVLLSGVYLIAEALLAVSAAVRARRKSARWDRLMREEVAELSDGGAAKIWPVVAVFAVVIALGV